MQGIPILAGEPRGLPLMKILPQYLKDLGYINRIIGKWHLGSHKSIYTPTFRGFDSHLGFWSGALSYYDHILQDSVSNNFYIHDLIKIKNKKLVGCLYNHSLPPSLSFLFDKS